MSKVERNSEDLMRQYWARCRANGDTPRPCHVLLAGPKSAQPGAVIAWGLNLAYVESRRAWLKDDEGAEIQLLQPGEAIACGT